MDISSIDMAPPGLIYDVLWEVFEHLPAEDLKKMRTICRDWERPATFSLGKCTHLNVTSLCNFYYRGLQNLEVLQFPTIKNQLIQKIKIKNIEPGLENPYFNFLALYKDSIQEILFYVDWWKGPTMMMKVLFENLTFRKLKKISIMEKNWHDLRELADLEPQTLVPRNIPLLTNIRELEFNTDHPIRHAQDNGRAYLPTFKELINQSPYLEKLKIIGNVYPNLNSASNLKSLEVTAFPLAHLGFVFNIDDDNLDENGMMIRPEFDMDKLQKMLYQVHNNLEELILNGITKAEHGEDFNTFLFQAAANEGNEVRYRQLPSFPKLKSLTINSIDGFIDNLALSPNSFPLLTKLNATIIGDPGHDLSEFLTDSFRPTVTELSLTFKRRDDYEDQRSGLQCLQNMATCLPNVKKLDVAWYRSKLCSESVSVNWVKELEKFERLEDLTIRINHGITLWKLLGGIAGVSFNGIKTLRIVATEPQSVGDEFSKSILETVSRIVPEIYFKGFYFKRSMVKILECFQASLDKGRFQWIA